MKYFVCHICKARMDNRYEVVSNFVDDVCHVHTINNLTMRFSLKEVKTEKEAREYYGLKEIKEGK